jgi:hypothetical protein
MPQRAEEQQFHAPELFFISEYETAVVALSRDVIKHDP